MPPSREAKDYETRSTVLCTYMDLINDVEEALSAMHEAGEAACQALCRIIRHTSSEEAAHGNEATATQPLQWSSAALQKYAIASVVFANNLQNSHELCSGFRSRFHARLQQESNPTKDDCDVEPPSFLAEGFLCAMEGLLRNSTTDVVTVLNMQRHHRRNMSSIPCMASPVVVPQSYVGPLSTTREGSDGVSVSPKKKGEARTAPKHQQPHLEDNEDVHSASHEWQHCPTPLRRGVDDAESPTTARQGGTPVELMVHIERKEPSPLMQATIFVPTSDPTSDFKDRLDDEASTTMGGMRGDREHVTSTQHDDEESDVVRTKPACFPQGGIDVGRSSRRLPCVDTSSSSLKAILPRTDNVDVRSKKPKTSMFSFFRGAAGKEGTERSSRQPFSDVNASSREG